MTRRIALAALLSLACAPVLAAAPQAVSFASLDGTFLKAWVFAPARMPPRGTVIALHGCGGLYSTAASRQGQLNPRHQAMAELLVAEGYAAVFPDSLSPRGEQQICTQKLGSRRIDQGERRADTLGALAWVAAQPWASPARIALLGWSHGGSAVLSATDATRRDVTDVPARAAVAIAFYPGCSDSLKKGYKPNAPLVLMLGEKDDWTPPGPCIELGKAIGAETNVFEDSYHDFDNPVGAVRLRPDVPNGVNPGRGVHAGANPAAREKAYARLRELLGQAFR
ncbi:MAG: dienelactone hydrolase family protein [Burkholderiales bacterium]|nr:dienelactone hydrolase family protein [Burkholderiales bacterium]